MSWLYLLATANWLGGPWLLVPATIAVLAVLLALRPSARKEEP